MSSTLTQTTPAPDRNHTMALMHALEWLKSRQFTRAEGVGLRVADADPANADAHFVSGVAAHELGNHRTALERLDRAIDLRPRTPEFHAQRGVVLSALDQPEAAANEFCRSLELDPADAGTLANLARVLLRLGDPHQAYRPMRRALALKPEDPTMLGDMAVILVACRQPRAALPLYEQALKRTPDDPELHGNYSRALLMVGLYPEGWQESEWRWQTQLYRGISRTLPAPLWRGEPLAGKRLLIVGEQGFGDAIQFMRYAPLLQERGATVIVQCRKELVRLFQSARGVDQALPMQGPLPEVDLAIPMLSLPRLLDTRLDSIPPARTLTVPPHPLPPLPPREPSQPLRVGLVWSGTNQRNFRFEDLAPLLGSPGVAFHALQLGPQAQRAREAGLRDWSEWMTDFAATATLMSRLDLLITIDTAAAHLAGSLGIPVWVLIHATADWRWGVAGESTPWYPEARLFRQERSGEWRSVIERVGAALMQAVQANGGAG
ncbi:MAG: glycosyltransferase family protein [Magnetococcales bacterium]|nr:glycosyltransferase family protein [Magnetococcales bacterium]